MSRKKDIRKARRATGLDLDRIASRLNLERLQVPAEAIHGWQGSTLRPPIIEDDNSFRYRILAALLTTLPL